MRPWKEVGAVLRLRLWSRRNSPGSSYQKSTKRYSLLLIRLPPRLRFFRRVRTSADQTTQDSSLDPPGFSSSSSSWRRQRWRHWLTSFKYFTNFFPHRRRRHLQYPQLVSNRAEKKVRRQGHTPLKTFFFGDSLRFIRGRVRLYCSDKKCRSGLIKMYLINI